MKKYDESDLYYNVQAELMDGEQLLWVGKPDPLHCALGDKNMLVSSVFVLVFCVFIFLSRRATHDYLALEDIYVLVFIAATLQPVTTPVRQYFRAIRTIYAITDQRVLIISGFLKRSTQPFRQYQMEFIDGCEYPNGLGDVIFRHDQHPLSYWRKKFMLGQANNIMEIGFFGVQDPSHVEALMLKTFMVNKKQSQLYYQ